jgi:DnaK suppressor protein
MKATEEFRANEITAIRESLLTEKSAILNKTNEFKNESLEAQPIADEADAASKDVTDTISIHLNERNRRNLLNIERALGKISDGTYGQCESCGEKIEYKRLEKMPLAINCIECQEELEDSQKTIQ